MSMSSEYWIVFSLIWIWHELSLCPTRPPIKFRWHLPGAYIPIYPPPHRYAPGTFAESACFFLLLLMFSLQMLFSFQFLLLLQFYHFFIFRNTLVHESVLRSIQIIQNSLSVAFIEVAKNEHIAQLSKVLSWL